MHGEKLKFYNRLQSCNVK